MKLVERAIFVDDVPATASFYETLLGTAPVHQGDGIAIFTVDGVTLLIHRRYQPGPDDLPPEDHIAFAVDDVDTACKQLEGRGLTIEYPPKDYDWGRSAYLRDPHGQLIELQSHDAHA